ncbi:DNA-binding protein WhiA [Bifidobacterium sp. ESL0682]|uniref:DNA-binding protein WhiA n=1 Tax=Bifidobacterium sp. ESL0682 TaxID=2983212 RepID=UPI0023F7DC43|nr:DNA-binding protein WhiA [Bifidobacterium sp. ESL0682]WEV42621.1 DNA-binding protein WhiA [Bifidobacterium sp. ESL0682]
MALLNEVKSELASVETDLPAAKMAQAATMMRFGGGLRPVDNKAVIRAQFDSLEATEWLRKTISQYFQREAKVTRITRQTPNGVVQRYDLLVERGATALALQTGLLDRRMHLVKGLPAEVISGNIAQVKAAWRGAFLARGMISDPGKSCYLEIICPSHETVTALQGAARRLGITAQARMVRSSERITLRDSDSIERMLMLMGAPRSAREWTGKRTDGEARGKANRLANFDDANMRRSAKAAAEATQKVKQAFEILGDDIPENLKAAGDLRLKHTDASLEELGRLADPPITKDAIAGRIRRLLQLATKTQRAQAQQQAE